MFSFTERLTDGNSDSWLGSAKQLTGAYTLKRYGSTDSLSSWAPNEQAKSEYTLRIMASTDVRTRSPPKLVDRTKLNEAFLRKYTSPQGQPQSETTSTKPNASKRVARSIRRTTVMEKASLDSIQCYPIPNIFPVLENITIGTIIKQS